MFKFLHKLLDRYTDAADLGLHWVFDSTHMGEKLEAAVTIVFAALVLIICFPFFLLGLFHKYKWPNSYKGWR